MHSIEDTDAAHRYGRDLLVGESVRLRALEERDIVHLERWWTDPEWQQLQQATVRPRPEGATGDLFRRWSRNDEPGAAGFSIQSLQGEFVGHVSLWGAALPVRAAALSIVIGPNHVGTGFGPDAVRIMVRYGFLAMGLNRIELSVWAFNTRARRAYEKAGFVEEGVRREAAFVNGEFADEVVMGLLRRDWRP
jgi:RimJ/RimL family protein N-acetyltransferase